MEIIIREMNLQDFEEIKDTLQRDFDEFWNAHIFEEELKNEYSKYFCAVSNNKIVGFAGLWKSIDIMHITNIVVKKDMRNNGIGKQMLEKLISYSKEQNMEAITLEVHEENSIAKDIYEKYNFKNVGIRKNYYKDKSAIILTLLLKMEGTNEKQ